MLEADLGLTALTGRENLTLIVSPRTAFPSATLPSALTQFVGREQELVAVHQLVHDARLVTLTGAGGSGKTRLALAVASAVQGDQPGPDVAWVELAALTEGTALAPYVALMLDARVEGRGTPEQACLARLQERDVLLVLDNCEHLVEACAQFVERLLRSAPRLRILATSREALGVTGERSWLVPTLALPPNDAERSAALAMEAGAVRLFVERARDALPSFALTDANVRDVVQICRRLDGLPLALELAAARIAVLTPTQLASRLDDRFALLTSGARSATPRQRTLRGTVDWSYELLSEEERLLLERLSVFSGGFTLDAAESVCGYGALPAERVLEALASLATKSLVAMQEEGGAARYRLLETIREYALDRHVARGSDPELAARHASYYRDVAVAAELEIILARAWRLHQVDIEHGNMMAALAWSAEHRQGTEVGLPLCHGLMWYWYHRQLWREGYAQFEIALATAEAPTPFLRASALHGLGVFGLHHGDPRTRERIAEARTLWREVGNERWLAFTSLLSAIEASIRGAVHEAYAHAETAVALALRQEDPWDAALIRAHGLVPVLNWRGEWTRASETLDLAIATFRAREYRIGIAYSLDAHAFVALQLGDVERAARLATSSLREEPSGENRWLAARTLRLLGAVAERQGQLERAVQLFGASDALSAALRADSLTADRRAVNELPAQLQARMGAEAYQAAWDAGHRMGFREAVAFALAGVEESSAEPTPVPALVPDPVSMRRASSLMRITAEHALAGFAPVVDAPALEVRALGRVEILRDGIAIAPEEWPYAKPRELLLYLLAHPEGRTREQIGLDFWPEISAAQVKNNFHVTTHHLRKVLGASEWVRYEKGRYRVATEGLAYDAGRFETEAARALKRLRTNSDDATAAALLAEVLDGYTGAYLEEEGAGDWHLEIRDRLARLHEEGLLELGHYYSAEGRNAEAAQRFRRLLDLDPVHEEAARLLMLCLARDDKRAEALRVYERLTAELQRALDAEPSKALKDVAAAVRSAARV